MNHRVPPVFGQGGFFCAGLQLGVQEAFTNNADFSGISEAEQLKVDAVIHKTFIDVDEEKTEAAAATAIGLISSHEYQTF